MTFNSDKLDGELKSAGIPIDGVGSNPDGSPRVDFSASATDAQKLQAQSIVNTHDPTLTPVQRAEGRWVPRLALAALVVRASASFSSLTATQKAKVQGVIDNAATNLLDLLT